ncbi:hypothetical protein Vretifemale_8423 [Volvox reticuliferus]|uniref:Uncharacterized protein n=1 Tax=Volvox reticuliferus TaxID=1737510 RepID=A0A8J4CGK3_9CHLO|nr:hypothetical protein Vretifemale_8423 [Volvox reticuliferus]
MTSLHHKSLHSSRRTLSCNSLSALRPASGRQIIHHRLRQSSYGQSCSSCPYRFFSFARGGIACSSQQNPRDTPEGRGDTAILLAMGALVLAVAVTVGYPMVADQIEDLIYSADSLSGAGGFGPADVVAGLLWGLSLFFASPLQQLLLFLGKIETERPSDWIIMQLARGPLGLDILDVNEAPSWLSYIAAGICLVSGLAISFGLQAGLGDSIWALSTGTGACLAAGVYEVGRPKRLNLEETRQLDQQWRDFGKSPTWDCIPVFRLGQNFTSYTYKGFDGSMTMDDDDDDRGGGGGGDDDKAPVEAGSEIVHLLCIYLAREMPVQRTHVSTCSDFRFDDEGCFIAAACRSVPSRCAIFAWLSVLLLH